MKKMTCKQLGGPDSCNEEFHAETFEEMGEQIKQHAMKMFQEGDEAHVQKMKEMGEKSKDPNTMKEWMEKKRKEFEALPEDK